MLRGIERRRIFWDDHDRRDLLARLSRVLVDCGMPCFGWALMPNHGHLIVRTGPVPLRTVMSRVNTGYARAFNLRHARSGYLFQNRYRSIHVEDESYLLTLVRYVHLNPVRAGIVPSLEALGDYPWTGHAALVGRRRLPFQETDPVLERFGSTRSEAQRRLLDFMGLESDEDGTGLSSALHLEEEAGARTSAESERTPVAPTEDLTSLCLRVCSQRGVDVRDLRSGARTRGVAEARAEIVFRASSELGLAGVAIAEGLGLSNSGVTRARVRGRILLDPDREVP